MKMIDNTPITQNNLTSTNAVESAPEWGAEATYAKDDIVQIASDMRLYQSLVDDNTGNAPDAVNSTYWLDIGPTNPWAMFDEFNDTQTKRDDNLTVEVTPQNRVTSIALFNVDASSITVTIVDPLEGEVYNKTFSMTSYDNVTDYYSYFFAPIIRKRELFIDNLPPYSGALMTVSFDLPGNTVGVGKMVIGTMQYLGATLYGAEFGRIDPTRILDDEFGNVRLIRRASRRRMSLNVVVARESVDDVGRLLDERRGLFTVFVGQDDYTQTLIDGFTREWRITIDHLKSSILSVDVEGGR